MIAMLRILAIIIVTMVIIMATVIVESSWFLLTVLLILNVSRLLWLTLDRHRSTYVLTVIPV